MPPTHDPLPPVADRRAPERRAGPGRSPVSHEPRPWARTAVAAALALAGGLVVLFLFFWLLGAIDVGDAVAATAVAILLALVWLAGYLYRHRQREAREVLQHDRERRGF